MSETVTPKPKKSVALSGVVAGNTALCTVGRSGNDLHYRGYDILDFANTSEFEEIAYLLVHGSLPTEAELRGYRPRVVFVDADSILDPDALITVTVPLAVGFTGSRSSQ